MVVVPLHHSYPWEVGLPSLAIDITRGCRNFSQLRIESTAVKLLTVLPSQSVLPSHTATSTVLAIDMLELEDMTHLPGVCVPFIPTLCSRCNLTYFARKCTPILATPLMVVVVYCV